MFKKNGLYVAFSSIMCFFFYFTGNFYNNVYIIIHSECIITRSIHMYNVGVLYNSMGIYNNKQCKILKVYLIFISFTWSAIHN